MTAVTQTTTLSITLRERYNNAITKAAKHTFTCVDNLAIKKGQGYCATIAKVVTALLCALPLLCMMPVVALWRWVAGTTPPTNKIPSAIPAASTQSPTSSSTTASPPPVSTVHVANAVAPALPQPPVSPPGVASHPAPQPQPAGQTAVPALTTATPARPPREEEPARVVNEAIRAWRASPTGDNAAALWGNIPPGISLPPSLQEELNTLREQAYQRVIKPAMLPHLKELQDMDRWRGCCRSWTAHPMDDRAIEGVVCAASLRGQLQTQDFQTARQMLNSLQGVEARDPMIALGLRLLHEEAPAFFTRLDAVGEEASAAAGAPSASGAAAAAAEPAGSDAWDDALAMIVGLPEAPDANTVWNAALRYTDPTFFNEQTVRNAMLLWAVDSQSYGDQLHGRVMRARDMTESILRDAFLRGKTDRSAFIQQVSAWKPSPPTETDAIALLRTVCRLDRVPTEFTNKQRAVLKDAVEVLFISEKPFSGKLLAIARNSSGVVDHVSKIVATESSAPGAIVAFDEVSASSQGTGASVVEQVSGAADKLFHFDPEVLEEGELKGKLVAAQTKAREVIKEKLGAYLAYLKEGANPYQAWAAKTNELSDDPDRQALVEMFLFTMALPSDQRLRDEVIAMQDRVEAGLERGDRCAKTYCEILRKLDEELHQKTVLAIQAKKLERQNADIPLATLTRAASQLGATGQRTLEGAARALLEEGRRRGRKKAQDGGAAASAAAGPSNTET